MTLDFSQMTDDEVVILSRALMEARFPRVPNDQEVAGSPVVREWHCALLEEQDRRLSDENRARRVAMDARLGFSWVRWRGREQHGFFMVRLERDSNLRRHLLAGGADALKAYLLPFVIDDELADEVLAFCARFESPA
jgi:hypothetical protein